MLFVNLKKHKELADIAPDAEIYEIMKFYRFKDIKRYIVHAFEDRKLKEEGDKWYPVRRLINDFHEKRKNIAASCKKTCDESMSAFRPQTTSTGKLDFPFLSNIQRKPEPLGTELKSVADVETGVMLALEIQEGKEPMKLKKYFSDYGATTACTLRLVDLSAHCGQVDKDSGGELFFADSWFASVKTARQCKAKGHDFIGPVKTSHRLYPKQEIEMMMANWPGGTSLVFESDELEDGGHVHRLRAIGYKYNKKKILCFVATDQAGSTCQGSPG
jgi:Transposase IS4